MSQRPNHRATAGPGAPVLARLRVGTRLMLLVLLPVGVVLAFSLAAVVASWHHASELRHFQTATRLSFATAGVAEALAAERLDTAVQRVRPGTQADAQLTSAQAQTNQALAQASVSAASWTGVAGSLNAARWQLQALRFQAAARNVPISQIDGSYSVIVSNLLRTARNLDSGAPTPTSGRAAKAYLAILQANEAAASERVTLAEVLGAPRRDRAPVADPSASDQARDFDAFRQNAAAGLTGELDSVLLQPVSVTAQEVRDSLASPSSALQNTSLEQWLAVSGSRLAALRHLEGDARGSLEANVSRDLGAAVASGARGLAVSLAVLIIVTALGFWVRRSIIRPLQAVSEGARTLSSGDLSFDIRYGGRDEIGDVAAAFTHLRVTVERLAGEIRSMNAAVTGTRLDYRADVGAFEGTWSRLLVGMNDTMMAFARLHSQEAALRRVATLVATGVPPEQIFDAVVAEMRQLLGADVAMLLRYEPEGTATVVATQDPEMEVLAGTRLTLDGQWDAEVVRCAGRPAQAADTYEGVSGSVAAVLREQGIHSSAAAPVVVENRAWGVMAVGWKQQQPVSPDTERRMAQFTELVATAIANADGRAEVAASRARVVAAADDMRRRIERDLHDGVQQRLVSLGLELRTAELTLPVELPELRSQLQHAADGLADVFNELREISRGIHPAILAHGGLKPALKTLARRCPVPVTLNLAEGPRLPGNLEITAYYVVSEALTNVAKHANASSVHVGLTVDDEVAELTIRDDGVGGADVGCGSGLIGLSDRVEAIGGRMKITSQPGAGTLLLVSLPIVAVH